MSERFSPEQQQLLALAAVFEAAQLADDVAQRGDCDSQAFEALIAGVMELDADNFDGVYSQPGLLREGVSLLSRSLSKDSRDRKSVV